MHKRIIILASLIGMYASYSKGITLTYTVSENSLRWTNVADLNLKQRSAENLTLLFVAQALAVNEKYGIKNLFITPHVFANAHTFYAHYNTTIPSFLRNIVYEECTDAYYVPISAIAKYLDTKEQTRIGACTCLRKDCTRKQPNTLNKGTTQE